MNKEEQRIAIAEACGESPHYKVGCRDGDECKYCGETWRLIKTKACRHRPDIPDYLNDLNAMHEAEKTVENHELWMITTALAEIVDTEMPIAHANASQRAEAFLRVIGKWKD